MQKEKFLIEDQILEFNNEVLIRNKTLQDCSISNGSILNLIFDESKCTIHIDVIELRGKLHELNVMKYDTVENVKKKIAHPVNRQRLCFKGKKLEKDCCIHHYGIVNNSHLQLVLIL